MDNKLNNENPITEGQFCEYEAPADEETFPKTVKYKRSMNRISREIFFSNDILYPEVDTKFEHFRSAVIGFFKRLFHRAKKK